MSAPVFEDGGPTVEAVIAGSGVVGAMMAPARGRRPRGPGARPRPRIERAQAVEAGRGLPLGGRTGSDFGGIHPRSPAAPAPLCFPPHDCATLSGPSAATYRQRVLGSRRHHRAPSCLSPAPPAGGPTDAPDLRVGRIWPVSHDEREALCMRTGEEMGVCEADGPARQSPTERSHRGPRSMIRGRAASWGRATARSARSAPPTR